MKKLLIKIVANCVTLYIVDRMINGINLTNVETLVSVGVILVLLDYFVKPIVKLISLPLTFLTLGLFSVLINVVFFMVAINLGSNVQLSIGNAVLASVLFSFINRMVNGIFK